MGFLINMLDFIFFALALWITGGYPFRNGYPPVIHRAKRDAWNFFGLSIVYKEGAVRMREAPGGRMNELIQRCRAMSDDDLESSTKNLCAIERRTTVELLVHLAVLDERDLALRRAQPSLYIYCIETLRFTEDQAATRINAARLAIRFPLILDGLASGKLSIRALTRLSPHLNNENHARLLEGAFDKSRAQLDEYIASIAPRPDIRDHIQRLPVADRPRDFGLGALPGAGVSNVVRAAVDPTGLVLPAAAPAAPAAQAPDAASPRERIEALSPGRFHFGFTGSAQLRDKVQRARQLLWHRFPQGHLENIFDAALEALLDAHDPERQKDPRKPKSVGKDGAQAPATRYIPRWVRAEVWKRDEGRCAYTTSDGVRCREESGLEYDHIEAFADGGVSDDPANIRLLCRAHNQLLARETFGDKADFRKPADGDGTQPSESSQPEGGPEARESS